MQVKTTRWAIKRVLIYTDFFLFVALLSRDFINCNKSEMKARFITAEKIIPQFACALD